mmetsp:Transcript_4623/g.8206  ORF Transcript_4623/g.8206 Transcript_4623/m.8206 type:complete len:132 (-) Transcript_4623:118-513(-)|eukprot:CAMPEP_0198292754 /NCGR_PEP_ID=MMETSP1449-20131203/13844_1 /TAXON_ID=420275 /ORGANISM="Attheya septentrionalis, Strain CCMP2084" /LENGTH=131 /DNA_ID=CAMNT_0043992043 /DNA_START=213 /DNA_END=611 /DNA_ORIENTATION=-
MKLVKLLQRLNKEQVTIELKNGTVIRGIVVGVDATMNCHLRKAKVTVRGKNPVSFATLSVRGSTMRAWLLPDSLNLDALLVETDARENANQKAAAAGATPASASGMASRGRGRGRGRGGGARGGGMGRGRR